MKIKFVLSILSLLMSAHLLAQNKADIAFTHSDYIIVWHEGGMVLGHHHHRFFCVTDSSVSADTIHPYGFRPNDISDLTLSLRFSSAAYYRVKDMPYAITPEMLEKPEGYFGAQLPDGGMYHVVASINGVKYKWGFTGSPKEFNPGMQKFVKYIYSRMP